ncbi:hypothetical protein F4604DRAFT_1915026 [Suillus subluteus]|nr:hypothetical protein F4604DRAFT_1915026 [Suillus subluteus]
MAFTNTTAPSTSTTTAPVPFSKFNIKWKSKGIDCTFSLVAYLMAHHRDCYVLCSENKRKKNQTMQDNDGSLQPSRKEKGSIHAIIVEIFAKDIHYSKYYQAYPQKFAGAVGNHLANHSGYLLSIMHMKSAPASTAAASSHPALDDNDEFYDVTPDSLLFAGDNDNDLNYDMLDDGAMDNDVDAGDSEMNSDGDKDYDMATHETTTSSKNHVDKHTHPFSPLPPP